MASRRTQRSVSAMLSVLGHTALVLLLIFGVPLASRERSALSDANSIETVFVSGEAVLAEMDRIEAEELEAIREREEAERIAREAAEAEQQRLADIARRAREAEEQAERDRIAAEKAAEERRIELARLDAERIDAERRDAERREAERIEAERIAAEQAAEEERRLREEAARLEAERIEAERIAAEKAAEEERLRQQELARQEAERIEAERQAAIQRERDRAAAEIAATVAAEEADRQARAAGLLDQWIRAIEARVTSKWIKPPNTASNLDCLLDVNLLPDGTVTNVRVSQCSNADENVVRSLENAVTSASPLPRRPEGIAYENRLQIRFRPTE